MAATPGLAATLDHTVSERDTAAAVGSGDVPVLATPTLLALAERATVQALVGALDPGVTSVGVRVELDHLAASPVGAAVRVEATLDRVEDRTLYFRVRVLEGERLAARGLVVRVLVDRAAFLRAAAPTPRRGGQMPEVDRG
jgi:predicted thioesterase